MRRILRFVCQAFAMCFIMQALFLLFPAALLIGGWSQVKVLAEVGIEALGELVTPIGYDHS